MQAISAGLMLPRGPAISASSCPEKLLHLLQLSCLRPHIPTVSCKLSLLCIGCLNAAGKANKRRLPAAGTFGLHIESFTCQVSIQARVLTAASQQHTELCMVSKPVYLDYRKPMLPSECCCPWTQH
jgi:hypothetical protein